MVCVGVEHHDISGWNIGHKEFTASNIDDVLCDCSTGERNGVAICCDGDESDDKETSDRLHVLSSKVLDVVESEKWSRVVMSLR